MGRRRGAVGKAKPESPSTELVTPLPSVNVSPTTDLSLIEDMSPKGTSISPPVGVLANKNQKKNKKPKKSKNGCQPLTASKRDELQQKIHNFVRSSDAQLVLPGLSVEERTHIHTYAPRLGLKTRSHGKDGERVLTISRHIALIEKHVTLEGPKLEVCEKLSKILLEAMPGIEKQLKKRFLPANSNVSSGRHTFSFGLTGPRKVPPPAGHTSLYLQKERKGLPIYTHRNKILKILASSQVLIVNGATGSGKSTQLPQYLLENAYECNKAVRIVVTQPRRIAAISVSGRIAQERGEKVGNTVGYQIRMNNKCSNNTVLTFTTGGTVLRIMAVNSKTFFANTTHLIIDEVHERDVDTDFLLLAAKLELQRNKSLTLILMSATMDLEALSSYFNNAPVINVEGRCYDVRTFHLEKVLQVTGYMTAAMKAFLGAEDKENIELEDECKYELSTDDEVEEACSIEPKDELELSDIKNEKDDIEEEQRPLAAYCKFRPDDLNLVDNDLIVSLVEMLLMHGQRGSVIIYLPGYKTMNGLQERLVDSLSMWSTRIILLHSRMNNESDDELFKPNSNVQLKIILSTNIGQTSITIPDLKFVIDTGISKVKSYDLATGASQLVCSWISQADAQQRAGRAGRRQPGICYRLYPTAVHSQMSKFLVPEIKRRTLHEICLLAKLTAPNQSIEHFLGNALDAPLPECVQQACAQLKLLEVLNDDESVTQLGKIIALLPLDVQLGKSVVYSVYYRCFGSVSVIAAFHSVHTPFLLTSSRSWRRQQQARHMRYGHDYMSDALGILTLYDEYIKLPKKRLEGYCEENFLCGSAMDMFLSAVVTLREAVNRIFTIKSNHCQYDNDVNMVRMALTAGLYPKLAYIDRTKRTRLISEGDPFLNVSRNSCLASEKLKGLCDNWILYGDKTRDNESNSSIEFNTLITTLMVAIQCGKQHKLEPCLTVEPDDKSVDQVNLCLDNWVRIPMNAELGNQLIKLRTLIAREVAVMLVDRVVLSQVNTGAKIVRDLMLNHDNALKLPALIALPD